MGRTVEGAGDAAPRARSAGVQGASPELVRGLEPGSAVAGVLHPPGSKSQAQRALLAAAFAAGSTELAGLPDGEDVAAARALLRALGARVGLEGASARVHGRAPGVPPRAEVALGESATLARLATALVALALEPGARVRLVPRGSLVGRASAPLFAALARAGAGLRFLGERDRWPAEVRPAAPSDAPLVLVDPVSSQEASALVLALAARPGGGELRVEGRVPSRPYLELTRALLQAFGAPSELSARDATLTVSVHGPLRAPDALFALEPDASAAAVGLAAACLSAGELRVAGLGRASSQGDVRIVEHLRRFGVRGEARDDFLAASGAPTAGAQLDLEETPDLAPVLAAVAAAAAARHGATSRFTGLAALRRKESDRLAVLAEGLGRAGWTVDTGRAELVVAPPSEGTPPPVVLDPRGDHRMVFAFALLGLVRPGVRIRDAGCVAKSWPGFWDDLGALGARVVDGTA